MVETLLLSRVSIRSVAETRLTIGECNASSSVSLLTPSSTSLSWWDGKDEAGAWKKGSCKRVEQSAALHLSVQGKILGPVRQCMGSCNVLSGTENIGIEESSIASLRLGCDSAHCWWRIGRRRSTLYRLTQGGTASRPGWPNRWAPRVDQRVEGLSSDGLRPGRLDIMRCLKTT